MKFIYLTAFTLLLASCKKDTPSTPVVENTTEVNVSGKIKRIIQSITGTRTAYITSFEYDATNRLTKFNEWKDDSTFTPIKITGARYCVFTYNGISNFPTKTTITKETGAVDSTLYSYDALNKVTREDFYRNNVIITRNAYNYISATLTQRNTYYSGVGGTLPLSNIDSIIYDSQTKIVETKFYNAANVYKGRDTYSYDTKSNPLSTLNVFKVVYTLYGDDRKDFYKSLNNLTTYNSVGNSSQTTITFTYNYSTNLFPISGVTTLTSGNPTVTQSSTLKYEYY
jgi:hypothetical protein